MNLKHENGVAKNQNLRKSKRIPPDREIRSDFDKSF